MKNKTTLIKRLLAATGVIALLFLSSCTKDEVFNSGVTREFSLRSAANGATYNIKVGYLSITTHLKNMQPSMCWTEKKYLVSWLTGAGKFLINMPKRMYWW